MNHMERNSTTCSAYTLKRAMLVFVLLGLPIYLLWWCTGFIFAIFMQDPEMSKQAGMYIRWLIPSIFPFGLLQCILRFLQTQNNISPVMISTGISSLVNVLLCWCFIFVFGLGNKGVLQGGNEKSWQPLFTGCSFCSYALGSDLDLCCICFDQVCKIEVQDCGHQMCAQCMLALCCHNKTNPTAACLTAQVWPFCKSSIAQLVVANVKTDVDIELHATSVKLRKSRRSRNFSEGSSSFKGLSDAVPLVISKFIEV